MDVEEHTQGGWERNGPERPFASERPYQRPPTIRLTRGHTRPARYDGVRDAHQGPARGPARLLRRRRTRRGGRRTRAPDARPAGLRAQADRPQRARGPRSRGEGRDLRGGGDRGPPGTGRGALGPRG